MPRLKERNEKERTKERDKKESSAAAPLYPPSTRVREDVVLRGADVLKMPHDEARAWMRFMDDNGWRFKDGTPVTRYTFMRSLRMWHLREEEIAEKRRAKREREQARQEREQARQERARARQEREQERAERMARRKEREAKRAARQARNEADKTRALSRKEQAFEAQEREIARRQQAKLEALKAQFGYK